MFSFYKFQYYSPNKVHTGVLWGDLKEEDHLEGSAIDSRIILKWIFETWVGRLWSGSIWVRIETGGGML